MAKRHAAPDTDETPPDARQDAAAGPDDGLPVEAGPPPAEPDPVAALGEELRELQDRHLRLAAEYDNFRKRTARERVEDRQRAQGELASALIDALDDLGRVAHLDPAATTATDVVAGVELVERKMLKALTDRGLERVGAVGDPFDPNLHEAIGGLPAPSPDLDQTLAAVFQPGYRLGATLLRPARVQVYMHADEGA